LLPGWSIHEKRLWLVAGKVAEKRKYVGL
jgi:hypothetical protein